MIFLITLKNKLSLWTARRVCKSSQASSANSLEQLVRFIAPVTTRYTHSYWTDSRLSLLVQPYFELLHSVYDVELSCTWSLVRDCPCHREQRK